jgi:hypothetical protein
MGATIEEITAKLEDAAKPVSESPTDEKETVAAKGSDETEKGSTKKGAAAQERIQELVAKAKSFEERAADLEAKLADRDQEVGKLIDLVKDRETDSRIVAKINELHATDPEYKEIVEKLDRAIRGLEPEKVEKPAASAEAPKPGEDLLKGIKGELDRRTEKQAAEIADQRSDLLLMKSELVLEKLFAQLPGTEYTEEDQRILNSALADFVDWDSIEANPALLEREVAGGFQKAVDWYGNPKGRIAAEAAKPTKDGTDAKSEETVDFSKLEFGKLKTVNVGGKERQAPAISDDEFAAMMGAALRRERGGK